MASIVAPSQPGRPLVDRVARPVVIHRNNMGPPAEDYESQANSPHSQLQPAEVSKPTSSSHSANPARHHFARPEVACVRARAERQGGAAVTLGVMGLQPYVCIMVRIGAIVLNVSDTASLDERRKEGS
jgi:hypothetical protein